MIDIVLTPLEMRAFNSRLAALTQGRFAVGPDPITRSQARSVWAASKVFAAVPPLQPLRASSKSRIRSLRSTGAGVMIAAVALSGCATLGGNVKGGFACRAPDGICAPTLKIDDQALAMISGGDGDPMPAGMVDPGTRDDPRFTPLSEASRLTRTSEKVLRIVFPAHVDRQGRYREASAIHAVVERSGWADTAYSASAQASASSDGVGPRLASADQGPSLAEMAAASPEVPFPISAPDASSAPAVAVAAAANDPNAPSAAAIVAARHRGNAAKAKGPMVHTSLFMHRHIHTAPASVEATTLQTPHVNAAVAVATAAAAVPLAMAARASAPASASANAVSLFDLRSVGSASPLQAIREKVGSIFAAHTMARPAATAAPAPLSQEHPVNGPAVLAVSGVDK